MSVTQMRQGRALAAILAIALTSGSALRAAGPSLEASLMPTAVVSDVARRALIHQVETVWREAGVEIRWIARDSDRAARALRIVVDRRPGATGNGGNVVAGELMRFEDGRAVVVVSIARAEAIVRTAGATPAHLVPETVVQDRIGMVLGRAVAHEIGHYLLGSAHARQGLMRSTFQPREFADPRSGTFDLDNASRARVHEQFRAALSEDGPLLLGRTGF